MECNVICVRACVPVDCLVAETFLWINLATFHLTQRQLQFRDSRCNKKKKKKNNPLLDGRKVCYLITSVLYQAFSAQRLAMYRDLPHSRG